MLGKTKHQTPVSLIKVSLYPAPSLFSRNQLAKESLDSVAPVVMPALAPTLDKSLKVLYLFRAQCYLLGHDLKQNNELVCLPLERF